MSLTLDDIKTFRKLEDKIEASIVHYYNKELHVRDDYDLLGWDITDTGDIKISYSFNNYLNESDYDYVIITINDLNKILNYE
jgi:hypothetical protein